MACKRKMKLKNGGVSYKIQCKVKNPLTQEFETKTTTWRKPVLMTEHEAKREVERVAAEFEKKARNEALGLIAKNDDVTFSEYADIWLSRMKKNYSPTTLQRTIRELKVIKDFFKNIKLRDISPSLIERFIDSLYRYEIREIHSILKEGKSIKEILEQKVIHTRDLPKYGVGRHVYHYAQSGQVIEQANAIKLCDALKIKYEDYFDTLTKRKPYSKATILKYKGCVSKILSAAKKERLIEHNYASNEYITPIKGSKYQVSVLNDEEAKILKEELDKETNPRIRISLYILLMMGIRRGELIGLEWKDIDFENRTMDISRSASFITGEGFYTKETKTASSTRVMSIPNVLVKELKSYKEWYDKRKSILADKWTKSDRIMLNDEGNPFNPSVYRRWLNRILEKAGLKHVSLHSLRHTNITLQLISGVDLKTVSARAGHSRASTTTDIYSHYVKNSDIQASNILDKIFE